VPQTHRIQLQPAYVLHHRPYRDTSRILEVFTRDHGRVSIFARGTRGARKGAASLASMLQPFNRLLVSWSAGAEAGHLIGAEFDGAVAAVPSSRLVSAFYVNELLLKLCARHDSHPEIFALYGGVIESLKSPAEPLPGLRIFEKRLLEALGYGLALEREAENGALLEDDAVYYYRLEQGATRAAGVADSPLTFSGRSLRSLAREDLHDREACADARRLLRAALDRCLEGRELKSRQVMQALRRQSGRPDSA
jgi:DNA repair protein RecO (recombination protein O)